MTCHFCFFIRLLICFSIISTLETKKIKVMLISVAKCEVPGETVDPTEPVTYETGTRTITIRRKQTTVAKTNFTISRAAGPVKMTLKINYLNQNSKQEIFKMEKVDCYNPVTYQLIRVINLKIDDDCITVPGNYVTENINPQDFAWILSKSMINPGKYEYVLEYYSEKGLAVCNSIICDLQEMK